MSGQSEKVESCIEALCQRGCQQVNGYIRALEMGEEFPEVAHLSVQERRAVLLELIAIMDVYDGACDSDD
jgi:hypothetical protein